MDIFSHSNGVYTTLLTKPVAANEGLVWLWTDSAAFVKHGMIEAMI